MTRRENATELLFSRQNHHKVFIIDVGTDQARVVMGSRNLSDSANNSNDENILIIRSQEIAQMFYEEFQRIYAKSGGSFITSASKIYEVWESPVADFSSSVSYYWPTAPSVDITGKTSGVYSLVAKIGNKGIAENSAKPRFKDTFLYVTMRVRCL